MFDIAMHNLFDSWERVWVPPARRRAARGRWFANLTNPNTKRGYENAVGDFVRFTGINRPEEFRTVTRAHIIAWRDDLVRRGLGGSTIRHRLASLASLFEYLCEKNAVTHSPVKDGERPKAESSEGKTPAIGDHQASKLLDAPQAESIKSTPGTNAKACRISGVRQGRQDPVSAAASRDGRAHPRLP